MRRFFHRPMADNGTEGHLSITDANGKAREFPVVGGIVQVPDDLANGVIGPGWEPYTGQRPLPEDHATRLSEMRGPRDVDKRFGAARDAVKA